MKPKAFSFFVCLVLLSGCGEDRPVLIGGPQASPPRASRSPVVLATIPEVLPTEELFTRTILRA